jgi:hypothetical protein
MNFSLKPHPLIAHWVPGVIVVVTGLLAWSDWHVSKVLSTFAGDASKATLSVLVLSVIAFVIGGILDSFRNCSEDDEVNWDFFFDASEAEVQRLNEYYFTYYVLSKNLTFAIAVGLLIFAVHPPEWACWNTLLCTSFSFARLGIFLGVTAALVFAVAILAKDSKSLRGEIKTHTNKTRSS